MQLDHYINTFGVYLKEKYQQQVNMLKANISVAKWLT